MIARTLVGRLCERRTESEPNQDYISADGCADILYEGQKEKILVKPPALSVHGMFMDLRFRLAHSGAQVETRAEVGYCPPGVGVGSAEFIYLLPEAEREIALEIG